VTIVITGILPWLNRLLISVLLLVGMLPAAWADLTFAHLSDTHFTQQGPDGSWMLLKQSPELLADMLNQLADKAQFAVITGNVVHSPEQWDALAAVISQSKLPVYVCLGNRDVANGAKSAAIQRLSSLNASSFTTLDRGYYSLSPKPGVKLLMLDTAGTYTGKGQIDPEQQAWIKQQLALESQLPTPATVVVAMHHPLVEPYASPSRRLPDSTRQAVLAQLEKSPLVSLVLSGAYRAAKVQQRRGILHVSTPALVEYPAAARLITLKDNGQMVLTWVPSRLKNLAQLSRSRSPWVAVANGNEGQDHQWSGPLRYYPTPVAVARVKQWLQTAVVNKTITPAKTGAITSTPVATKKPANKLDMNDMRALLGQTPTIRKTANVKPVQQSAIPKPAPLTVSPLTQ
jgi:3',5'-cyclic AMP phosphodiesterase CpdA